MSICAFEHIAKSLPTAGHTRHQCIAHPAANDDFIICQMHVWTCVCLIKSMFSTSCSWWWLYYMSKYMYGQVLMLPSQFLVHPAADDDFVICQNAHMDVRLCYQVDV